MLACSLLKMSRKSWYSLGIELRSTDALETSEQAFVVTPERASWKTSVLSILQMQMNAAMLMRVIFSVSNFKDTSWGLVIGVAREAEACKGRDIGDELSRCGVVSNEIFPNTQSIDGL